MPLQSATSMCSRTKTMTTSLTVSDPLPAHKSSMPPAPCKKTSRLQFAQSVTLATTVGRACRRTSCATTRTAKKTALRLLNMPVLKSQHCLGHQVNPRTTWIRLSCGVHHARARPLSYAALRCRPHFAREQHKQDVMLATFLGTPPRFLGQRGKNLAIFTFPAYGFACSLSSGFCAPDASCPTQTAPLNTLSLCVGLRIIPR